MSKARTKELESQTMTTLQEVKQQIKEIMKKKHDDFAKAQEMFDAAKSALEKASEAKEKATAEMDLETFHTATADAEKAQAELEMYEGKLKQLEQQKYITEAESDAVIDSLLDYEKKIMTDFETAVASVYEDLDKLLTNYKHEIKEIEATLHYWEKHIHANYLLYGNRRIDKETGRRLGRKDRPQPIRPFIAKNMGGATAKRLEALLRAEKDYKKIEQAQIKHTSRGE